MKITKVNIFATLLNNGINDIEMYKLGQVVLIAGKNGSGKTRLLNNIISVFDSKPKMHKVEESQRVLSGIDERIQAEQNSVDAYQGQVNTYQGQSASPIDLARSNFLKNMGRQIESLRLLKTQRDDAQKTLNWNLIETNELAEKYTTTHFVPKTLDLQDSNQMNKNSLMNAVNNVNAVGVEQLPSKTFATIQYVQDIYFNATHQNFPFVEEKEKAIKDYEKLKESVEIFLNTTIERNANGDATLFGFPLGQTNLSDGQKILLQFCIAIYHQEMELKDLILFMDEPENHLHPSVIVETIDRISKFVANGQIWIATHSIPLLAHFDSNSIWYMENGSISHAGNIPEKVLESLLGNEEEIAKLQDFIGLPAQLALNRYAYECLFEPQAVITGKADPQILQIRNELGNFEKEGRVKILDYGAGKGRLLANIVENLGDDLQSFTDRYEYIAFDKFDSDKMIVKNYWKQYMAQI